MMLNSANTMDNSNDSFQYVIRHIQDVARCNTEILDIDRLKG